MKKYFFTIIIFILSCAPTKPVETYDDNAILQLLLNMADSSAVGFLINEFDIDGNGTLYCTELPNTLDDTVSCTMENGRFTKIKLSNMGLSGAIPESIGDLTELTHLGLKNNNLTGEIPENIGNLTNLTQLNLAGNTLSGSIPDTIFNLQKLVRLDISNNQFTGSIPNSIDNLTALEYLYLQDNNLSGTIPDEICNIYKDNYTFDLSGNQFCPPLPDCLDDPDKFNILNCDTSCGDRYDFLDGYCYSKTDLSVLDSLIINQDSLNVSELQASLLSLNDLCHQADYVTCHLPLTDETKKIFNYEMFCSMKPTAFFLNLSRGGVVNEEGLLRALQNKQIAGAALDVRQDEPPMKDMFSEMENVILTPHVGGITEESRERVVSCVCKDVAAVLQGERPIHAVNSIRF